MEIQIHKYILYVYGIQSCLFLLGSLENVCQIMHDSATLELEFAPTGAAQERRTLILDLLVGVGIAADSTKTELAE